METFKITFEYIGIKPSPYFSQEFFGFSCVLSPPNSMQAMSLKVLQTTG